MNKSGIDKENNARTRRSGSPNREQSKFYGFHVDVDLLEKMKVMAFYERRSAKEVMKSAITREIELYEKENGEIVIPKSRRI